MFKFISKYNLYEELNKPHFQHIFLTKTTKTVRVLPEKRRRKKEIFPYRLEQIGNVQHALRGDKGLHL